MRSIWMTSVTLALLGAPAVAVEPEEELKLGVSTYKTFCSHCHGINMVNPGTSSYDLRVWPTDKRASFADAVVNGRGDMPAWGDVLAPNELDALWRYVATRGGKEPFPDDVVSTD